METTKEKVVSKKLMYLMTAVAVLAFLSIIVTLVLYSQVAKQNVNLAADGALEEVAEAAQANVVEVEEVAVAIIEEPEIEPEQETVTTVETKPKSSGAAQKFIKPVDDVTYHETLEDAIAYGKEWQEGQKTVFSSNASSGDSTSSFDSVLGVSTHTGSGVSTDPGSGPGGAATWGWAGEEN
jgi:type II secretory pathway pseudopilin PulG